MAISLACRLGHRNLLPPMGTDLTWHAGRPRHSGCHGDWRSSLKVELRYIYSTLHF